MTSGDRNTDPTFSVYTEIKAALAASVARVLVNPDDVDDTLQETYLRVHGQAASNEISSLKGYFFRVARNVALKTKKDKQRTLAKNIEDLTGFEACSEEANAEEKLHYSRKLDVFMEVAKSLPPKSRQAFLLKKVAGLSQKQIARKMGIAESTVEKHLIAAMNRTTAEMNKRGYTVRSKKNHVHTPSENTKDMNHVTRR